MEAFAFSRRMPPPVEGHSVAGQPVEGHSVAGVETVEVEGIQWENLVPLRRRAVHSHSTCQTDFALVDLPGLA